MHNAKEHIKSYICILLLSNFTWYNFKILIGIFDFLHYFSPIFKKIIHVWSRGAEWKYAQYSEQ